MREILVGIRFLLASTLLFGVAYPFAITILAQWMFADAANGSLVRHGEQIVGSSLIGQHFTDPSMFWGRPSATAGSPNNALASGGSNLGTSHADLEQAVAIRAKRLRLAHPARAADPLPVDLLTASASGLDPHISPEAAYFQVERVAAARQVAPSKVAALVEQNVEQRTFGILGERRVNVLKLNLNLKRLSVEE